MNREKYKKNDEAAFAFSGKIEKIGKQSRQRNRKYNINFCFDYKNYYNLHINIYLSNQQQLLSWIDFKLG